MRFVEADSNADDGDEELANHHGTSAIDEERATTELLHGVEGDGSRADIDECKDQGDQECVADGARGLQEGSRVVEDEVDTSPLLHHLKRGSKNGLAHVGSLMPERASETIGPTVPPAGRGHELALILFIEDDLGQF